MNAKQSLPDDLMNHFQGRSLKSIVAFTIFAHIVLILLTSIPFLLGKFSPAKKLSEEDRTKLAVKEATQALRKIAETHNIQPQQLSSQMAGGPRPAPKPVDNQKPAAPTPENGSEDGTPGEGEVRGNSDVENKLREKLPPPELPPVNNAEDLFK